MVPFISNLNAATWIFWTIVTTVVLSVTTLLRLTAAQPRMSAARRHRLSSGGVGFSWFCIVTGILALCTAGVVTLESAEHHYNSVHFTQLWLAHEGTSQDPSVRFTIRNLEASATSYNLALLANETSLNEWRSITLQPGETWSVLLGESEIPTDQADAQLYLSERPGEVYRHVKYLKGSGVNTT